MLDKTWVDAHDHFGRSTYYVTKSYYIYFLRASASSQISMDESLYLIGAAHLQQPLLLI